MGIWFCCSLSEVNQLPHKISPHPLKIHEIWDISERESQCSWGSGAPGTETCPHLICPSLRQFWGKQDTISKMSVSSLRESPPTQCLKLEVCREEEGRKPKSSAQHNVQSGTHVMYFFTFPTSKLVCSESTVWSSWSLEHWLFPLNHAVSKNSTLSKPLSHRCIVSITALKRAEKTDKVYKVFNNLVCSKKRKSTRGHKTLGEFVF